MILSHIAIKLQARQFSQNYLSEKTPGSKKIIFKNIDGTVTFLLYDLECEFLFLNNVDIKLILELKKKVLENII